MKQESTLVHLFQEDWTEDQRCGTRTEDRAASQGLVSVKNPALRLAIFGLMREEIERSAEQVARMERERGFPDGIRLA